MADVVQKLDDISHQAKMELVSFLKPFFQQRKEVHVGGGSLTWEDVGLGCGGPPSFPMVIGELAATNDLRGYWRLGESASPFADTSGQTIPEPLVATGGGTAYTADVTGALPPADDDGAVQFNAFIGSQYLSVSGTDPTRFYFQAGDDVMTVAAWFKPTAGTTTDPATIAGLWLDFLTSGGIPPNQGCGYRLGVNYPGLTPFFQRRSNSGAGGPNGIATGAPMVADTWYFLVGTYDSVAGHKLYMNGALSATDTATHQLAGTSGFPLTVGYGVNTGAVPVTALGVIDEASVWGAALTLGEIATLYEAGLG